MSQESHRIYKKLVPLEKKYKYYKRCLENGDTGGIQSGFEDMVLKYRYDYLKMKLEYETLEKGQEYRKKLEFQTNRWWGLTDLINEKLEKDSELIILRRTIMLLKLKLLKNGTQKQYL